MSKRVSVLFLVPNATAVATRHLQRDADYGPVATMLIRLGEERNLAILTSDSRTMAASIMLPRAIIHWRLIAIL